MSVQVDYFGDQRTGTVVVRLSSDQHRSRRKTRYTLGEWREFIADVKAGVYDAALDPVPSEDSP